MADKGLGGFIALRSRAADRLRQVRPVPRPGDAAAARTPSRRSPAPTSKARSRRPRLPPTGPARPNMFGDAAVACSRRADRRAIPTLLQRHGDAVASGRQQPRHRGQGRRRRRRASSSSRRLEAEGTRCAAPSTRNFLTALGRHRPAAVGVWGALKGSFLTILVTMALAFPIGVLAALYLEEFAPRNRWTDADRGIDQQPRRGAVDHLRPARPRGVPQRHEPAALGAAGRRA